MLRTFWFLCIAATLWFAFAPPSMGGLGGEGYHGLAFVTLGVLTPLAFPRVPLWVIWMLLVILGGGIELVQEIFFGVERDGEWADFVIDVNAATASLFAVHLARRSHEPVQPEDEQAADGEDRADEYLQAP